MTLYELEVEYEKMCDLQPHCNTCKYEDDNAPCALVYGYEKGRAEAIEEIKELVKFRLIGELGLEDATKYGNKNAKQQANSYATVMKYEIAYCVDDLLDDLEQMKDQNAR